MINSKRKTKNKNKEVELKIMNSFLIFKFITFCSYQSGKQLTIIKMQRQLGNLQRGQIGPTQFIPTIAQGAKLKIGQKLVLIRFSPLKLINFTHSTILFHITNLGWPILLALYLIKCEMVGKMLLLIIRLFENTRNLV